MATPRIFQPNGRPDAAVLAQLVQVNQLVTLDAIDRAGPFPQPAATARLTPLCRVSRRVQIASPPPF